MVEGRGLYAEHEASSELGQAMRETLSSGDHRVVLTASMLSPLSSERMRAYNDEGEFEGPEGRFNSVRIPIEVTIALEKLRSASYRDGVGTWFGVVAQVLPDGQFTTEYDYDNEPAWPHPIDPVTYVNDLKRFPREEQHRPAWLKQKIAEAEVASGA